MLGGGEEGAADSTVASKREGVLAAGAAAAVSTSSWAENIAPRVGVDGWAETGGAATAAVLPMGCGAAGVRAANTEYSEVKRCSGTCSTDPSDRAMVTSLFGLTPAVTTTAGSEDGDAVPALLAITATDVGPDATGGTGTEARAEAGL